MREILKALGNLEHSFEFPTQVSSENLILQPSFHR